jgi:23S rRNA pseudouridine2605 synthase
MTTMRLNKFIAHSAGLSRREADDAIERGRVKVNGAVASLGTQVNPSDIVILDGVTIGAQSNYTYLLLNKPVGYVCSRRAQGDAPTIYSLLPQRYNVLKTVGRLDRESSGLIMLTDDGDFAHRMTHPSFSKTKVYEVELDQPLAPLHQQMISDHGIDLDDGKSRFTVTSAEPGIAPLPSSIIRHPSHMYEVHMQEGRNRQIRRTFAALGYTVTRLHRTTFGPYTLTNEKPGEFHLVSNV